MQNLERFRRLFATNRAPSNGTPSLTSPASARHFEPSGLFSMDDETATASPRLFDVAIKAITAAQTLSLESMRECVTRSGEKIFYPGVWPGEHYRLLAALVQTLQPKLVIEIGTATGMSAISLMEKLPTTSRLVTFDILPWKEFSTTVLKSEDFDSGRLVQNIADLSDANVCKDHAPLLSQADIIFIDAAKDGQQETRFLKNFAAVPFVKPPLLVFDDIRLWNMLRIWREIRYPKLDLTSFGHWSGTGLVDFTSPSH